VSTPLTAELRQTIAGDVLDDEASLGMYSTDASMYQIKPLCVVLPKNADDVRKALKAADKHRVTVLPRGGGTSLAGQTVGQSMVLDFSKYMNALLEVNVEERWARVQPGLVRDNLNAQLAEHGLHFAPDPATSSRANIGGMIGNNSSGTKSILYGKTVDHVIGATVILADGTEMQLKELTKDEYIVKAASSGREAEVYDGFRTIIETNREGIIERYPKVMRRVGGYNLDEFTETDNWNLAKLVCGSEGTLAATVEATINLEPLPQYTAICVVHFAELLEAIEAVQYMLPCTPSCVEILDATVVQMSRENLTTRQSCGFIEGDPAAIQIVEFYGDTQSDVIGRAKEMADDLRKRGMGYAYPVLRSKEAQADAWVIRKSGLGLMLGVRTDEKPQAFIEDAAIPLEHLPTYIDQVLAICKKHETPVAMYAHASVGVIHVRPMLDLRHQFQIDRLKAIAEETFQLVVKYGGSWSGEHGDGLVRSPWNERFFGPELYQALKNVKRLFDPENRMNPGKIVDSPGIDQNLRYGADYSVNLPPTVFKYRRERSFSAAIDMCTGVGACRQDLKGVMCPSFMATRDEEHSTRGRANALRLAMSGQLGDDAFTGDRLHQVLDLCLSCKGCKSECPSNVDMAKLKGEVMQARLDVHGIGLRDELIADSADAAARIAGPLAPLVNAVQGSGLFRNTVQRFLGFHPDRRLPDFAREPFTKWLKKEQPLGEAASAGMVVLFVDTYMNFYEPHVGQAAWKLLRDCGYEVIPFAEGCCQRPRISHGMLRDAKREGTSTLRALDQYMREGLTVVGCEPSCVSALNDDLPDLVDSAELAARASSQIMMIDAFIAAEQAAGRITCEFESDSNILVHGHCHQKSLYSTAPMKEVLSNAGAEVTEVDSGCCGMAGSFGYETEHYAISEKIGERRLFPAVREHGDTVVACGFSCRHQIEHFTGCQAKHWVETVRVRSASES
jgi:FAD/FMN-containing dehydrogenase/Fe-S oxidoreductase